MAAYIARRSLWLIPVVLAVSLITFLLMHLAPGSPFQQSSDKVLPADVIERLDRQFGLDAPLWQQYLNWLGGMVTGDLGPSYRIRGRDVLDLLGDRIWISLQLGLMAFGLAVVLGIPLGMVAALNHNRWPDYAATFISVIGIATPSFVLAALLVMLFSDTLHWLPTGGWRAPQYWVLPTVALSAFGIAQLARFTRAGMLDVMRYDYVRTARSKGLRERTIVLTHVARNACIPVVTVLGPLLVGLVTGSFVVETIYGIPGVGRLFVAAIGQRDYGVIMAVMLLYSVAIAVMNLVVDVAYAWVDPRIRYR
ncbi:MAG TPA: ABC transporter permease [Candidatus Limnocylindrales bacterium]|nr:ABC transporter permease [Candidatus Limnocylindrales bacterium]